VKVELPGVMRGVAARGRRPPHGGVATGERTIRETERCRTPPSHRQGLLKAGLTVKEGGANTVKEGVANIVKEGGVNIEKGRG